MIQSVFFLSRSQAESFTRKKQPTPYVVISITDPLEQPANLGKTHMGLIRLQFEDVYEEVYGNCKVGQIPDKLPDDLPLIIHNEQWPDANHAQRIFDFIDKAARKEEKIDIVAHCEGGISRSAAVAQFVADKYSANLEMVARDASGANKRLLRMLNKINDGQTLDVRINFESPDRVFWGGKAHLQSMGWA